MATDELFLEIGDVLQLQFLPIDTSARYYVKVIGYLVDKSLIVTTPQINGKVMLVREAQQIAVRLLSGSNVVAFTVSVLRSCMRPYPYLHLSYPVDLQTIMVRKAQRIGFKSTATVRDCGPRSPAVNERPEAVNVSVEDMSTTGALLISSWNLGKPKELISIELKLHVAGDQEILDIVAVIRNVRERALEGTTQKEFLHGVEFQFADRPESIMLHAFIYEQIVNSHV